MQSALPTSTVSLVSRNRQAYLGKETDQCFVTQPPFNSATSPSKKKKVDYYEPEKLHDSLRQWLCLLIKDFYFQRTWPFSINQSHRPWYQLSFHPFSILLVLIWVADGAGAYPRWDTHWSGGQTKRTADINNQQFIAIWIFTVRCKLQRWGFRKKRHLLLNLTFNS